jgi:hypothetical protein
MAFGWSFPKFMVLLVLAFFLLGLPLMALLGVFRERDLERRGKASGQGREPRGK